MHTFLAIAFCCALQGENPVGTYTLTFQPRAEVMTATLVIARRDSGYRASITMRQLRRVVTSDSVSVTDGRLHVYLPSEVADLTFDFGIQKPKDDVFLVHLDDGDMHGLLQVGRPAEKKPDGVPRTSR
ncbi:MAG TPA: hypothetical protein VGQ44_18540 [Gemmatimonadaceae bacterium]|nr:hypothetical protein [Gemmatimonadaceae bacterium]